MTKRSKLIGIGITGTILSLAVCSCMLFHTGTRYGDIHYGVLTGDTTAVALLLAKDIHNLNAPDNAGLTPLHLAALHCEPAIAKILLNYGADANRRSVGGPTPLHLAAQEGCVEVVKLLIARGAEINIRDDSSRTALARAVEWGQDSVVVLLIAVGAKQ